MTPPEVSLLLQEARSGSLSAFGDLVQRWVARAACGSWGARAGAGAGGERQHGGMDGGRGASGAACRGPV